MKKSLAGILLLAACHAPQNSGVKEAPDSANKVSRFQISEMPTYGTLLKNKALAASKLPWSDSYWPTNNRGLARRWSALSPNSDSKLGFSSFFSDQIDLGNDAATQLSPSEKYDAVYRWRWRIDERSEARDLELKELAKLEEKFDREEGLSKKRELFQSLFDRLGDSVSLQESAPMAAAEWSAWFSMNKNNKYQFMNETGTGDGWGWMGYCHGWAPAAVMAETPLHAVLAVIDGKEMLFSEGDIRGLLTKSWADHYPVKQRYFLGKRCNENTNEEKGPIPHGNDGRGVSGTLRLAGQEKIFTVIDEYLTTVAERRVYQVLYKNENLPHFLLEKTVKDANTQYYLSDDILEVRNFVAEGAVANLQTANSVKFYGCWDVNPASFHTVLIDSLGKKNMGLVMDRTRTGQVWNQPIQTAEFDFGELQSVADVEDPLFRYRAMGTEYLLKVTAKLSWSSEPANPRFDYPDDFDAKRMQSSSYSYTLEFDADKRLIGGEWGDFGKIEANMVIPDFLFAFKKGALPLDDFDSSFDYSGLIGPIHACSLATEGLESRVVNGETISYTRCPLTYAD